MAQQVNLENITANKRVEQLYTECRKTFENARTKANKELNTLIKLTAKEKEESVNLKNELEKKVIYLSLSVEDIYRCQDKIEVLMDLNEKFSKILKKYSFEANEWMPRL